MGNLAVRGFLSHRFFLGVKSESARHLKAGFEWKMMGWWGLGLRCYHPGWLKSFCVVTSLGQELLIWQVFGRKMETTKNEHFF